MLNVTGNGIGPVRLPVGQRHCSDDDGIQTRRNVSVSVPYINLVVAVILVH